jgi:acyl-CoA thioester hydrolase
VATLFNFAGVGMRPSPPLLENVIHLPGLIQCTVPGEWEDQNGHVNIQHYMTLYDKAGWPMVGQLGLTESYFKDRRCGLFELEHHIRYLAELHVGDLVSIHTRMLERNEKRFHGMMFVANRTRAQVASTLEFLTSGADLESRKTSPFPPDIADALDRQIAAHDLLAWPAPVCGVMSI